MPWYVSYRQFLGYRGQDATCLAVLPPYDLAHLINSMLHVEINGVIVVHIPLGLRKDLEKSRTSHAQAQNLDGSLMI